MADIFESIGRTNALSEETGKLSDLVLRMREQEATGQQRQIENLRADKEQAAQLATRRVQDNLLQQEVERERQRAEMDIRQIDITRTQWFQSKPPEVQKVLLDDFEANGLTKGGRGAMGPIFRYAKATGESKEDYEVKGAKLVDGWTQAYDRINKEVMQLEIAAKGDKAKLQKSSEHANKVQEREIVRETMQRVIGTYEARRAELERDERLHQQALTLEREKAKSRGVNKPTALIKNTEFLSRFMSPEEAAAVLAGHAVKPAQRVKLREEAYRWAIDQQGDTPEEARAYANKVDRELSKGSGFNQGAGSRQGAGTGSKFTIEKVE